MDEKAIDFWNHVKPLIKQEKTTQEGLAKTCNISFGTFQGWIAKKTLPNADEAVRIAAALNTTVEYLVTGEKPVKPNITALINEAEELVEKLKQL